MACEVVRAPKRSPREASRQQHPQYHPHPRSKPPPPQKQGTKITTPPAGSARADRASDARINNTRRYLSAVLARASLVPLRVSRSASRPHDALRDTRRGVSCRDAARRNNLLSSSAPEGATLHDEARGFCATIHLHTRTRHAATPRPSRCDAGSGSPHSRTPPGGVTTHSNAARRNRRTLPLALSSKGIEQRLRHARR